MRVWGKMISESDFHPKQTQPKGLSPLMCTPRIYLKDNDKPSRETKQILEKMVNPNRKDRLVFKVE